MQQCSAPLLLHASLHLAKDACQDVLHSSMVISFGQLCTAVRPSLAHSGTHVAYRARCLACRSHCPPRTANISDCPAQAAVHPSSKETSPVPCNSSCSSSCSSSSQPPASSSSNSGILMPPSSLLRSYNLSCSYSSSLRRCSCSSSKGRAS